MTTTSTVRIGIPRFTLRRLLFLFVPISILLAGFAYYGRQRELAVTAWNRISSKGIDAHFPCGSGYAVYFKNGNVTDDDLIAFIPAFNDFAPSGFCKIERIELGGSKVSSDAIDRFRRAVPDCEIVR
jgi:hypothetical protein